MEDLFKALQLFQQGVQQYATGSAISEATKHFNDLQQQVQQGTINEQQGRQAFQNLSNQVALRLAGTGATGTQIQSAFNAISPQNFGSAEQMQLEGALSGNKELQRVSQDIIKQREDQKYNLLKQEYAFKQASEDRKFSRDIMLEQMKLSKQGLKPEELQFQTNVNMANTLIDKLSKTVERSGTWESGLPLISNKKDSAILDQVPYQLAIQYAKIVDPNSVAREGEVAAAQKYLLNLGMFSNKEKALQSLKEMKSVINQYQSTRSNLQDNTQQQQQQNASAANVQVRVLKNGERVKVVQNPDGTWSRVP